ncbi:MAG: efflux transporter, RND family, MFP subunit [Candidatus Accumulibacter appositus]|uniref:Efflux transporter, RND family, MFP subunit n=1 Tax=Candidatus Accumulibacter appositus TaxID=1454003 RepID=A0A011NC49_9PROT|nr:HlyD family efflux transporter periplasmic adaptor subunit [Accumulibacter sp.]EXI80243.1 MAG: efflux transporter, RND family, MFP subunit [Candidatus Accumulibacter appositus]HRF06655.1 HlyD family efflux transporter periplasmic adaptor subunit [Accumulibacter sp.]
MSASEGAAGNAADAATERSTNVETGPATPLQVYFGLASSARAAASLAELQFLICNDSRALLPFRQAMLLRRDARGHWRLVCHSGLSVVDETSPYKLWLEAVVTWRDGQAAEQGEQGEEAQDGRRAGVIEAGELPESLQADWHEWLPAGLLALPLAGPEGPVMGWWLLARDEPWQWPAPAPDPALWLPELQSVYGHALWAWLRPRRQWLALKLSRRKLLAGVALLLLLGALPVRLSVLAPAEITPIDPQIVAAPMDGVVKRIPVAPGAQVSSDEVLVEFDDTLLVNRRQVLEEATRTSRADLLQAEQQAFDDQHESRMALSVLRGKLSEKQAELESIARQSQRLQVRPPAAGVFIYGDQLDWAGKPLQTGERIGLLADPEAMNVTVWVPVADAINLQAGAEVRVYLHVAPLHSLPATLTETSFAAQPGPDGVVSYRIKARLEAREGARIGLKGTAKIYGERMPVIYLLLRRPLASLRTWCGC